MSRTTTAATPSLILTQESSGTPEEVPPGEAATPSLILTEGLSGDQPDPVRYFAQATHPDANRAGVLLSLLEPSLDLLDQGEPLERSPQLVRRGTTNRNDRGGSAERRRRRIWLVETYRADCDLMDIGLYHGPFPVPVLRGTEGAQPACRCYRCGVLLTADTLTVDRIVPGCRGGTYRRSNIRPACGTCNSSTGATTRRKG